MPQHLLCTPAHLTPHARTPQTLLTCCLNAQLPMTIASECDSAAQQLVPHACPTNSSYQDAKTLLTCCLETQLPKTPPSKGGPAAALAPDACLPTPSLKQQNPNAAHLLSGDTATEDTTEQRWPSSSAGAWGLSAWLRLLQSPTSRSPYLSATTTCFESRVKAPADTFLGAFLRVGGCGGG